MSPRRLRTFAPVPYRKRGYSPNEAAALMSERGYSVSGRTISREIKAGSIKAIRTPGGYQRITKDEIERYLCVALDTLDINQ